VENLQEISFSIDCTQSIKGCKNDKKSKTEKNFNFADTISKIISEKDTPKELKDKKKDAEKTKSSDKIKKTHEDNSSDEIKNNKFIQENTMMKKLILLKSDDSSEKQKANIADNKKNIVTNNKINKISNKNNYNNNIKITLLSKENEKDNAEGIIKKNDSKLSKENAKDTNVSNTKKIDKSNNGIEKIEILAVKKQKKSDKKLINEKARSFGKQSKETDNMNREFNKKLKSVQLNDINDLKRNDLTKLKNPIIHEKTESKPLKNTHELKNKDNKINNFKQSIIDNKTLAQRKQDKDISSYLNINNDVAKIKHFSKDHIITEQTSVFKPHASDLSEQIVQKVKVMLGNKSSSMEVQLKPEYLGKVKIVLHTLDGQITARLITDNNHTASMLNSGLNNLKDNLEQQGLKIQHFEVDVGGQEQNNNYDQNHQGKKNHSLFSMGSSMGIEDDIVEENYNSQNELYGLNILA
jgi:flagellar hook-length control protein FliK